MPTLKRVCKDFCGTCPTFQENSLPGIDPHVLFCARGKSKIPTETLVDKECNCSECPIFVAGELEGGWFCFYGIEGKE